MKVRTGARTASKVQQKDLISNAKKLRKDPSLLMPKCVGECRKCPFKKLLNQLERVASFADEEKRLIKFSKSGDQLVRAYAAALLLAHEGKIPYLAVARFPFGEVAYAIRGKVRKEKLIGVQHFNEPLWRMLAFMDFVKTSKINLFSTKARLYCTGSSSKPPKEYLEEVWSIIKYPLKREEDIWHSESLDPFEVRDSLSSGDSYLRIKWVGAGVIIGISQKALKDNANIFGVLTQQIAGPELNSEFDVSVIFKMDCDSECADCPSKTQIELDFKKKKAYFTGALSDLALFTLHANIQNETIMEAQKPVYILESHCFGNDLDSFIDSMKPTREEKVALKAVLSGVGGSVLAKKTTPSKLLAGYWPEWGSSAINAVVGDSELAEQIFKEYDITNIAPSQILIEADMRLKKQALSSVLPSYNFLPPLAKYADEVARVFKIAGKDEAVRVVDRHGAKDTKIKSVAHAFLQSMGADAGKAWQFSDTEIDYAHFLKEFTDLLLEAEPSEYHEALERLLSATGSTEKIEKA